MYQTVNGCKQSKGKPSSNFIIWVYIDITIHDIMIRYLVLSIQLWCSVNAVFIRGKGASFPNEVYKRWQPAYVLNRKQYVALDMNYDAVGSSTGRAAIFANINIEYAGSDSTMSDTERNTYTDLVEFPTMAGWVPLVHKLMNTKTRDVRSIWFNIKISKFVFSSPCLFF